MREEGTCRIPAARKRRRQSQDITLPGQAGATAESRCSRCCTQLPARFYRCKRLEKSNSNVEQFALVRREQRILQKHVYRAVVESGSGPTAHVLQRVPQPAGLPPGVTNFSMNTDRIGKLSFISYLVLKGGFSHIPPISPEKAPTLPPQIACCLSPFLHKYFQCSCLWIITVSAVIPTACCLTEKNTIRFNSPSHEACERLRVLPLHKAVWSPTYSLRKPSIPAFVLLLKKPPQISYDPRFQRRTGLGQSHNFSWGGVSPQMCKARYKIL